MKVYSRNVVIKYKKNKMDIILNSKELYPHNDNMEFVLIDIDNNEISLKGNYISVFFQNHCCEDLNFNHNKKIPISSVRKKYLDSKKKFIIFGKYLSEIKEGYFELVKSNNRIIKSNSFTIKNAQGLILLNDNSYKIIDLILNRYNQVDGDESEKWFRYEYSELLKASELSFEELNEILDDLINSDVLERESEYWRIK